MDSRLRGNDETLQKSELLRQVLRQKIDKTPIKHPSNSLKNHENP
jgi:hypothetical protein